MSSEDIDPESAEVLDEQPKSILMSLISQLTIGMDLSKVTLPTFILEARSMLQKLTDFYIYGELLKEACQFDDPAQRLVALVKWYCSGFSFKPKGVKKPYNPILGEWFRCKWVHSDKTTTYYIAEQVSHHPPISCFSATNRKAGFVINGCVRPKSKYYGNSSSAFLEGGFSIHMLRHNEEYTLNFPTYVVRGVLFGTLMLEICGNIVIKCVQTGLSAEIEFKPKPFFGGEYHVITGRIKNAQHQPIFTLSGHWDSEIYIEPVVRSTSYFYYSAPAPVPSSSFSIKSKEVLWGSGMSKPLKMVLPSLEEQDDFESIKLWKAVSDAIRASDQDQATFAKSELEQAQRDRVRSLLENDQEHVPSFFEPIDDSNWKYKYLTLKTLDPDEEEEIEIDGIIATNKTRPPPETEEEERKPEND